MSLEGRDKEGLKTALLQCARSFSVGLAAVSTAEAQAVQDPRTRRTDSLNTSVLGDVKNLPLQTQGPEFKFPEPMYSWTAVHVCNLSVPVVRWAANRRISRSLQAS